MNIRKLRLLIPIFFSAILVFNIMACDYEISDNDEDMEIFINKDLLQDIRNREVGIIVNKKIYSDPEILSAINLYADHIQTKEHKSVWIEGTSFNENTDIKVFKDALIEHYNTQKGKGVLLEGVVLVGDLPNASFEMENDGKKGYSNFPCDLYFMDLDGAWLDDARNGDWDNQAQTGYFDGHVDGSGTKDAEIWISRIIGSKVPYLGPEKQVTLDYFKRVKERMQGRDPIPSRCLTMGNNWDSGYWSSLSRKMVQDLGYTENETIVFNRPFDLDKTWKNELRKGYEYVNLYEHSGTNTHYFHDSHEFWSQDYTTMVDQGGISNARFYNLFACYNCRYTENNFLGGLYAWGHNGLLAVGSTKSGEMREFFNYNKELADGKCFGEAFRLWFNTTGINDIESHYGMTLLGAGTLKLVRYPAVIEGPSELTSVADGSSIQLSWNDLSDNETGFRIERAVEDEDFTEHDIVDADTTIYTDSEVDVGIKYYYRVQAYNDFDNSIYTNIDFNTVEANISPEGTVEASSHYYPGNYTPGNVNDNNTATQWLASRDSFPQWVTIDLESERSVTGVEIVFAVPGIAGDCYDFIVETSLDNTTWTGGLDHNPNSNTAREQSYSMNAIARYVRVTITDAPGSLRASMYEFRIITGSKPLPPENLSAIDDYWDQVQLSWNETEGASSYTVKRSMIPGGPYTWIESGITETTFKTINLEKGKKYYFIVSGVNDAGEGEPSAEIEVVAPSSPPFPPTNLSITPNQDEDGYTLKWKDRSNNQAEYFWIERREKADDQWMAWDIIRKVTACVTYSDTEAKSTSLYEYRVYAYNTLTNLSGASNTVNTKIPPASPFLDPPSQEGNEISLHWEFGGSTHDGFIVKRSSAKSRNAEEFDVSSDVRDYTDDGVDLGTLYIYQICAYNQYPGQGCSQPQVVYTKFTIDAPTNLDGTSVSSSAIDLNWADNSSDEEEFQIEIATSSDGPFTPVDSLSANTTSFVVEGLEADTEYFFRVKAVNNSGYSDYSNTFSATTHPQPSGPSAPTNLFATAVAPNQINLVWDDNSNDENWYRIERSINDGTTWGHITDLRANTESFENNDLTGGITYSYRVRASNKDGGGAWSNIATATTPVGGYGNLAIGATATASTEYSESHLAINVTDDNTSTRWRAENGSFPQWVSIDLGNQRMINEVEFMFEFFGISGGCDFIVQTSSDNVNWTTRIDQSNSSNTDQTQRHGLGVTARYFRITFIDIPGGVYAGINEFRLFGQQ